jgi:hypothetical protein
MDLAKDWTVSTVPSAILHKQDISRSEWGHDVDDNNPVMTWTKLMLGDPSREALFMLDDSEGMRVNMDDVGRGWRKLADHRQSLNGRLRTLPVLMALEGRLAGELCDSSPSGTDPKLVDNLNRAIGGKPRRYVCKHCPGDIDHSGFTRKHDLRRHIIDFHQELDGRYRDDLVSSQLGRRPMRLRVFCNRCNHHEGFRGLHELHRHHSAVHKKKSRGERAGKRPKFEILDLGPMRRQGVYSTLGRPKLAHATMKCLC